MNKSDTISAWLLFWIISKKQLRMLMVIYKQDYSPFQVKHEIQHTAGEKRIIYNKH